MKGAFRPSASHAISDPEPGVEGINRHDHPRRAVAERARALQPIAHFIQRGAPSEVARHFHDFADLVGAGARLLEQVHLGLRHLHLFGAAADDGMRDADKHTPGRGRGCRHVLELNPSVLVLGDLFHVVSCQAEEITPQPGMGQPFWLRSFFTNTAVSLASARTGQRAAQSAFMKLQLIDWLIVAASLLALFCASPLFRAACGQKHLRVLRFRPVGAVVAGGLVDGGDDLQQRHAQPGYRYRAPQGRGRQLGLVGVRFDGRCDRVLLRPALAAFGRS